MNHKTRGVVKLEQQIRDAEMKLFGNLGSRRRRGFPGLPQTGLRVRLLSPGSGPPVLLLHGVSLSAAAWAPLFAAGEQGP